MTEQLQEKIRHIAPCKSYKTKNKPCHVGAIIMQFIRSQKWSQADFAEVACLTRQHLSIIIYGKHAFGTWSCMKIAAVMDVEPIEILVANAKDKAIQNTPQFKDHDELTKIRSRSRLMKERKKQIGLMPE